MNHFHFKANKTFQSVLCVILAVVFLVATLMFISNYTQSKDELKQQIESTEQTNIQHFKSTVQSAFNQISLINAAFAKLYMMHLDPDDIDAYNNYTVFLKQITLCITMYDYVDGVYLKNQSYEIEKGLTLKISDLSTCAGTYKNTEIYIQPRETGKRILVFYQAAQDDLDNAVAVAINGRNLGKQLLGNYQPQAMKFITDQEGNVLATNRNDYIGKNVFSLFSLDKDGLGEACRDVSIKNEDYIFSSTQIDHLGLYCVSITSAEMYNSYAKVMQTRNIELAIILIICTTLLALLLTYIAYRPLRTLMKTAYNYYPLALDESHDEIQVIQNILKNAHYDNKVLRQEIGRNAEALRHQQILALQAQISPHFIFNVLDSINWMSIQMNGYDNVLSKCVQSTQTLFAYCMNYNTLFATFDEELEIAKSMAVILSNQFNLEIEIYDHIPQELKNCKILKLCLEPILENAIIHGYANYTTKGAIHIFAFTEDQDITVKIQDYGVGMSPEELTALKLSINQSSSEDSSHIGIRNVNLRLKLLFGDGYFLDIESQKNAGTTFILHMPKLDL